MTIGVALALLKDGLKDVRSMIARTVYFPIATKEDRTKSFRASTLPRPHGYESYQIEEPERGK